MFDDDSLTEAADADGPNMDDFYRRVVSSDEEDFDNSDDGSITDLDRDMSDEVDCCDSDVVDLEWDTGVDACSFAFRNAVVHFCRKRLISGRRLCSGTAYF